MKNQNAVDRLAAAVERAEMPSVLFPADMVRHFPNLLNERHAARAVRIGLFGPWFTVNGEPAVLRESLRQHLGVLIAQRKPGNRELLDHSPHGEDSEQEEEGQRDE